MAVLVGYVFLFASAFACYASVLQYRAKQRESSLISGMGGCVFLVAAISIFASSASPEETLYRFLNVVAIIFAVVWLAMIVIIRGRSSRDRDDP